MRTLLYILISGIAQAVLVIRYEWTFLGAWVFVSLIMTSAILVHDEKSEKSSCKPQHSVIHN